MTERIAATTLAQVLAAVGEAGATPAQVHRRVGAWSRVTIRNSLRHLVAAGAVVADGPECRRRYSRAGVSVAENGFAVVVGR